MKLVALKPAEAGFVCVDAVLTATQTKSAFAD